MHTISTGFGVHSYIVLTNTTFQINIYVHNLYFYTYKLITQFFILIIYYMSSVYKTTTDFTNF